MQHQPLDDLELEELENFLDSDAVHEDCQNFVMAHGFLTALSICPNTPQPSRWLPVVFEESPNFTSEKEQNHIENLLKRLLSDIQKELESEDDFLVPCEIEMSDNPEELSELQEWASGFMEGVFFTERSWFETEKEETVAELLLPFMVASDLFEDEEVQQIRESEKLTQSCISQIPQLVTDLFLVLRTEPEKKPKPQQNRNKKAGKNNKSGGKKPRK
ncbi:YecA family protein [Marinomonas piezotolerans]|uniref:YecA family protein n=1 Tax=Marinomonas piezotolerans TaxID=2213058 RepID=A0A370UDF3_9GAMM|nr:YecA family protein [Marinomonas piezotolerans]RDL45822.1 YecA family protein [Marinomonas piezotolerans]